LMTRRMPKISVSPLATKKSNSPSWTPFKTWMRKKTKLSEIGIQLSAFGRQPKKFRRRPSADG